MGRFNIIGENEESIESINTYWDGFVLNYSNISNDGLAFSDLLIYTKHLHDLYPTYPYPLIVSSVSSGSPGYVDNGFIDTTVMTEYKYWSANKLSDRMNNLYTLANNIINTSSSNYYHKARLEFIPYFKAAFASDVLMNNNEKRVFNVKNELKLLDFPIKMCSPINLIGMDYNTEYYDSSISSYSFFGIPGTSGHGDIEFGSNYKTYTYLFIAAPEIPTNSTAGNGTIPIRRENLTANNDLITNFTNGEQRFLNLNLNLNQCYHTYLPSSNTAWPISTYLKYYFVNYIWNSEDFIDFKIKFILITDWLPSGTGGSSFYQSGESVTALDLSGTSSGSTPPTMGPIHYRVFDVRHWALNYPGNNTLSGNDVKTCLPSSIFGNRYDYNSARIFFLPFEYVSSNLVFANSIYSSPIIKILQQHSASLQGLNLIQAGGTFPDSNITGENSNDDIIYVGGSDATSNYKRYSVALVIAFVKNTNSGKYQCLPLGYITIDNLIYFINNENENSNIPHLDHLLDSYKYIQVHHQYFHQYQNNGPQIVGDISSGLGTPSYYYDMRTSKTYAVEWNHFSDSRKIKELNNEDLIYYSSLDTYDYNNNNEYSTLYLTDTDIFGYAYSYGYSYSY